MPVLNTYTPNTFCFPGFCSGDAAACTRFYSEVLDWTGVEVETPEGNFTSFKYEGDIVAGMYQMADDRKAAGVRPHWNAYICVTDADEAARKVEELGGKVITPPFDGMGDRMANVQDPDGVRFSVFQSKKDADPIRIRDIGALVWSELYAANPDSEKTFYSQLLGWQPQPFPESPMPYTTFNMADGSPAMAGMLQLCDEMKDIKPQWVPYFMVEDTDEAAARAKAAGGKVMNGPMDIPNAGRIAFIADAEGALFGIIKPCGQNGG